MLTLAICAGLLLGLPVLGLFPPQKTARAFNGMFVIHMPKPPIYGDTWRSVLAQ